MIMDNGRGQVIHCNNILEITSASPRQPTPRLVWNLPAGTETRILQGWCMYVFGNVHINR